MTPEEREMLLEMPAVQELLREEREACARIADEDEGSWSLPAQRIRARGTL